MKIYVKAAESRPTELDIFRYESKLCKFMRDNYGMSCSINNNNYVCNLMSDERLACIVASPDYFEISVVDHWAKNGIASELVELKVPYNMPLNDATAQEIIKQLSFTDDERSIRNTEKERVDNLIANNKVMNEGNYVVAFVKAKLSVRPDSRHTGTPRFSDNKITRIEYTADSTTAEEICNICNQLDKIISNQLEYPKIHNIKCDIVDNGATIRIKNPCEKMIVNPSTLEIIEIRY